MVNKIEKVLKEFKYHKLHSGSKKGPIVKNRKQAIAIAFSEQRKQKNKKRKSIPKMGGIYIPHEVQNKMYKFSTPGMGVVGAALGSKLGSAAGNLIGSAGKLFGKKSEDLGRQFGSFAGSVAGGVLGGGLLPF